MTDITRPKRFVNGIADHDGRRAFVRTPSGRVVALDLSNGAILWRSERRCLPVLAFDSVLLALRAIEGRVEVVLLDAESGGDRTASRALDLPGWVGTGPSGLPDVSVDAILEPGGALTLSWRGEAHYRGGAPPPAEVTRSATRMASGSVLIDPASGEVRPFAGVPPTLAATNVSEPVSDESLDDAAASLPPDVLEQCETPERHYQLIARESVDGTQLVVRAIDRGTQERLWESVVDESPPMRPTPLRR